MSGAWGDAGRQPVGMRVAVATQRQPEPRMKIILWIILAIFLIGLLVVIGFGKLIF